jgi:hypothetical protein
MPACCASHPFFRSHVGQYEILLLIGEYLDADLQTDTKDEDAAREAGDLIIHGAGAGLTRKLFVLHCGAGDGQALAAGPLRAAVVSRPSLAREGYLAAIAAGRLATADWLMPLCHWEFASSKEKRDALDSASITGDVPLLSRLAGSLHASKIEAGLGDMSTESVLHTACSNWRPGVAQYLYEKYDVDMWDVDGATLMSAAEEGGTVLAAEWVEARF